MQGNPENLYRRGETWWLRYFRGGELVRESTGTSSLKEAREIRDAKLGRVRRGTLLVRHGIATAEEVATPSKVPTVAELASEFEQTRCILHRLRPNTIRNIKGSLSTYLRPALGARLVSEITVDDARRFLMSLAALAPGSRRLHYTYARAVLAVAVRRRFLASNPFADPDLIPPTRGRSLRRAEVLDEGEANGLLADSGGDLRAFVALGLLAGLRMSEIFGLRWRDVATDTQELTIEGAADGASKTVASLRTVPLHAQLAVILAAWREDAPAGELVLPRAGGGAHAAGDSLIKWHWPRLFEKAKITRRRFTPHDLRHAFASHALMRGVPLPLVSKWLGHKSAQITADVYSHFLPSYEAREIGRLPFRVPLRAVGDTPVARAAPSAP